MLRVSVSAVLLYGLIAMRSSWGAEPNEAAFADDPSAARLEFMLNSAAEFDVVGTGEDRRALEFHREPLLRFSNDVSGVPDGIVAMWKDGTRPAVFAQVFQTKEGAWIFEGQSIAATPYRFSSNDEAKWSPREAAPDFKLLPEAESPAASATARLRQMRRLAGRFAATDDFKIHFDDTETVRYELRLLPTPVYRYDDAEAGILDGAVFAFVHGTDPEALLVLEARRAGDQWEWRYTLAALTCWAVQARLGDEEVWSTPERFGASQEGDLYHVWVYEQ